MSLARIAAIVRADFLIRFRRVSTIVAFLVLSGIAYFWVPSPSTGRTLIQIDGQRAIYNSATIAVGTSGLAALFIGLAGFYVISNALRHDLRSGCGSTLASTQLGSMEYIVGKFAGNVLFLSTFTAGFMATAMGMLLIRAEAPLQPIVFVKQYLLIMPPTIVLVSVLAILFESIPWLSGRFGDVVYFIVFMVSLGLVATLMEQGVSGNLVRYFDFSGMAYMTSELRAVGKTPHMSIGSSRFDPSKGVFVFEGLRTTGWLLPRIGATLLPLPLLLIARMFFHRFDPARVRVSAAKGKRNLLALVSRPFKPITQIAFLLGGRGGGTSLLSAARNDALLTLTALPIAIAAIGGIAIATLAGAGTRRVLLVAFAALAIVIADVASREKRSGTSGFVFAAPHLRERFALWKFATTLLLGIAFLAAPAIRIGTANPTALIALGAGLLFLCATATVLGITTSNPKTFLVLFLSFFYVLVNDRGANPSLDFAGIYGTGGPAVIAGYAAFAIAFVIAADVWHRWEVARR